MCRFSMAGFEVIIYGRFWVIAEDSFPVMSLCTSGRMVTVPGIGARTWSRPSMTTSFRSIVPLSRLWVDFEHYLGISCIHCLGVEAVHG
jgi:hypothetical protein